MLALVSSRGRVYAWGLGGAGQLGTRVTRSVATPQVVLGPWVSPNGSAIFEVNNPISEYSVDCVVKHIFSGGDHCFATVTQRKVQDRNTVESRWSESSVVETSSDQRLLDNRRLDNRCSTVQFVQCFSRLDQSFVIAIIYKTLCPYFRRTIFRQMIAESSTTARRYS